jgi:hypothetical protein
MGYGQAEKPCNSYRPWKGQEPLCGNCAWVEREHKKMQPYQQRVVEEKKELDEKIGKLAVFISASPFRSISEEEQLRMKEQIEVMKRYSQILEYRIAAFSAA